MTGLQELIRAENIAFAIGCLLPSLYIAYTDAKTRMVYDKATFPILLAGLVSAVHLHNLPGALLGSAFAFAVLFACAAIGGAGGGDVKYAAGLGMWFGFREVQYVLLIASLVGVAWGMVRMARTGKLKEWLKTLFTGIYLHICGVKGAVPVQKLPDDPDAPASPGAVPFGTCLAVAAWAVWTVYLFR